MEAKVIPFETDTLVPENIEKALAKSERRYRFLFEATNDAVLLCGHQGRILDANPRTMEILGYEDAPTALLEAGLSSISPALGAMLRRSVLGADRCVDPTHLRTRFVRKDGRSIAAEVNARLTDPVAGVFQLVIRPLAADPRSDGGWDRTPSDWHSLLRATPDTVLRLDASGLILQMNRAIPACGRTPADMLGQALIRFIHPVDRQRVEACLEAAVAGRTTADNTPIAFCSKASAGEVPGSPGTMEEAPRFYTLTVAGICPDAGPSDAPTGHWVMLRDVTEEIHAAAVRDAMEKQLLQAQKLEAIGALTGGIAHDFNNILSAITGYAQLAQMALPEGHKAQDHIQHITAAGLRAKSVVGQILAFSRASKPDKQPVALGPVIKEALKLLRASLPATIEIRQKIDAKGYVVMADPTKIYQILMNLFTNALHALESRGGYVEVSVTSVELAAPTAAELSLEAGRYLRLVVTDNGCGMAPALTGRIFEPYFTTKAAGKGTGLGLSTVRDIVEEIGGRIAVESELGAGTLFTIHLPGVCRRIATKPAAPPVPQVGCERILFVDDEPALADLAQQMLGKLGYRIDVQNCPLRALDTFRDDPDRHQLVITDLTMPKMTGDALAREILKLRPEMPVLICTGYSDKISHRRAEEIGIHGVIHKPFAFNDLSLKIRGVLDRIPAVPS